MKAFVKSILQRIGDLIIKNIALKVEAALIVTALYLADPATAGAFGFALAAMMWLAVVGFRYAEKVAGLARGGK